MVDKAHDLGKAKGKTYESIWAEVKPKLYKEGKPDPDQQKVIMEFAFALR